jgi:hypothetical protein
MLFSSKKKELTIESGEKAKKVRQNQYTEVYIDFVTDFFFYRSILYSIQFIEIFSLPPLASIRYTVTMFCHMHCYLHAEIHSQYIYCVEKGYRVILIQREKISEGKKELCFN